jgi:hypothetical protein
VHVAGQDRALNSVEGEVLGPVGSESCMLALNSLGGLICWFMRRGIGLAVASVLLVIAPLLYCFVCVHLGLNRVLRLPTHSSVGIDY